jgi:hypothetical protein
MGGQDSVGAKRVKRGFSPTQKSRWVKISHAGARRKKLLTDLTSEF